MKGDVLGDEAINRCKIGVDDDLGLDGEPEKLVFKLEVGVEGFHLFLNLSLHVVAHELLGCSLHWQILLEILQTQY